MADISAEIAEIELATSGSEMRQPIANALNALNSGVLPIVSSSDVGKFMIVNQNGEWVAGNAGLSPTPTGTKQITENGTHDVTNYASADVDVPNSYDSSDEGKVVSNGELVDQSSQSISANGIYDTTLKNEVVVNVSGGGSVLIPKIITENGTYNAVDDEADGYSSVNVNVSGGGGGNPQYYTPIVSPLVSSYTGKIVVDGCFASFTCRYAISSTSSQYQTLFTIPQEIRPYGFYLFDYGNGGEASHWYGKLGSDGEIKIYTNKTYGFFTVRWFVAKSTQSLTYDSSVVSSILDGGVAINGNMASLRCVVDASLVTGAGWRYGILTIPSAYKPDFELRPFIRSISANIITTNYAGISYNTRPGFYIKDTAYNSATGEIDIYIDATRGKYLTVEMDWIIPSQ